MGLPAIRDDSLRAYRYGTSTTDVWEEARFPLWDIFKAISYVLEIYSSRLPTDDRLYLAVGEDVIFDPGKLEVAQAVHDKVVVKHKLYLRAT